MSDSPQPHALQHARLPFSITIFFTISQSLLKCMSIESVIPSNHLVLCRLLLLLPSLSPSLRVFSNESALHIRGPKYWNFSFSISPSNKYSGLISFRIDWFDLLAFQGTLKSLLQHHSLKESVLQCLAFFMVQLSHPYMTTGKTIALTMQTFVSNVMSLLFNMLFRFVAKSWTRLSNRTELRFVLALLPRSKLLNNHWQENVGSHHKKIPCIQGQRRSPNKMVGGVQTYLEWNLIPTRDTQRVQTKNALGTPGHWERISDLHKRLRQTCLWVFECLQWRHGSAVACLGDSGSGCSRPGRHGVWQKSS